MTDQSHQLVQKLWNYCNILRDDGLSYGDYVEQLTFLLFLKMADEQSRPPFNKPSPVPKDFDWQSLLKRDGDELETHYRHVLESLGKQKGMLGVIFRKAQNKIQDPAKLRRLIVDLIDKEQWSSLSADVKGDAYEGLVQKNAEDVKGGGGFRYYRLAPSLLQQDKWGNWVINKEYKPEMLAEAVCKLEGFTYAPSDTVYWQHGHSTEQDFIYVTTQNLSHDQLQQLSDEVGPNRTLLVMCTAFRSKPDRYPNLTIKKIPKAVLSRCEWGKDDYSLRVENLPKAPPPERQMELIAADGDGAKSKPLADGSDERQEAHGDAPA